MRSIIGLGLAVVGASLVAVGVSSATAAGTDKIVYHAKLPGRNNEIMVVSAAGGAPTRLTRNKASDSNPTWSSDRKAIAFESNRRGKRRYEDSDVYVMNADGTRVRELTFSNGFDGDPAWSLDDRIAFESERTGNSEVWAIDANGANERQLTDSPAFDGDPAWSPNGEQVAFTSARDNGAEYPPVRSR